MDKNGKYRGFMEQNEKNIGVGKEIVLLIYEHNVSHLWNKDKH